MFDTLTAKAITSAKTFHDPTWVCSSLQNQFRKQNLRHIHPITNAQETGALSYGTVSCLSHHKPGCFQKRAANAAKPNDNWTLNKVLVNANRKVQKCC